MTHVLYQTASPSLQRSGNDDYVASASGHALVYIVQSSLRGLPAYEQLGTNKVKTSHPLVSVERETEVRAFFSTQCPGIHPVGDAHHQ